MKQSTKRLLSSLIALLFLGGAVIVFLDLIRPTYDTIEKVRGEQVSRQQFIDTQTKVVKRIQELISSYDEKDSFREAITLTLPLDPDVSGALTELNGLLSLNNITPLAFSVSPVSAPGAGGGDGTGRPQGSAASLVKLVGTLDLQFRAQGSYGDFKKFVSNLETNVRIFDLKALTITPTAKQNADSYTFEATVAAYYQNP